jgi:phytanoyl-CoA hydroxylase
MTLNPPVLTPEQKADFERDGFIIIRNFADVSVGNEIEDEIITTIRADPPKRHQGEAAYRTGGHLFIQPEQKIDPNAKNPEDLISKVFNPHLSGATEAFATSEEVANIVSALLDSPASIFQSQFIFKNPGAWGQPWHQDAYYFPFDRRPEIGVWLAISDATLENGCLAIIPGGHKESVIYEHGPDLREGANLGYTEIAGLPEALAVPVLMQPGDCLFFHSMLPHRSFDNRAKTRRSAMVLHYAASDTIVSPTVSKTQASIFHWRRVGQNAETHA